MHELLFLSCSLWLSSVADAGLW